MCLLTYWICLLLFQRYDIGVVLEHIIVVKFCYCLMMDKQCSLLQIFYMSLKKALLRCVICAGNKSDLESMRQVPFEEVLGFAERNNMFHAMETSAKENINIEETFIELARVTKLYSVVIFPFSCIVCTHFLCVYIITCLFGCFRITVVLYCVLCQN